MGAVTHIGKISLKFEEVQDTIISLSFELNYRNNTISVFLIPVNEAPVVMKEYEYIPFLAAGTFEEKGTRFAKFKVSLSLSDSKSCKFKTNKDNSDSRSMSQACRQSTAGLIFTRASMTSRPCTISPD